MGNTLGYRQNSPNNDFNPVTQGALSFSITQNLLNGFGLAVNNRAIRIAKNQLHISDLTFKQQVIATVNNVVEPLLGPRVVQRQPQGEAADPRTQYRSSITTTSAAPNSVRSPRSTSSRPKPK